MKIQKKNSSRVSKRISKESAGIEEISGVASREIPEKIMEKSPKMFAEKSWKEFKEKSRKELSNESWNECLIEAQKKFLDYSSKNLLEGSRKVPGGIPFFKISQKIVLENFGMKVTKATLR